MCSFCSLTNTSFIYVFCACYSGISFCTKHHSLLPFTLYLSPCSASLHGLCTTLLIFSHCTNVLLPRHHNLFFHPSPCLPHLCLSLSNFALWMLYLHDELSPVTFPSHFHFIPFCVSHVLLQSFLNLTLFSHLIPFFLCPRLNRKLIACSNTHINLPTTGCGHTTRFVGCHTVWIIFVATFFYCKKWLISVRQRRWGLHPEPYVWLMTYLVRRTRSCCLLLCLPCTFLGCFMSHFSFYCYTVSFCGVFDRFHFCTCLFLTVSIFCCTFSHLSSSLLLCFTYCQLLSPFPSFLLSHQICLFPTHLCLCCFTPISPSLFFSSSLALSCFSLPAGGINRTPNKVLINLRWQNQRKHICIAERRNGGREGERKGDRQEGGARQEKGEKTC